MKNIHVLPTENSSRLSYNKDGVLELHRLQWRKNTQNMYITNEEKFVRDEYITDGIEVIKATPKLVNAQGLVDRRDWKKIILTTDQDLIKDGVQSIDEDFLEWFVKNPSCVEVETYKYIHSTENGYIILSNIIIPQEEPKQGYICPQTKKQCDDECCVSVEDCHIKASTGILSYSKQETLEEAVNAFKKTNVYTNEIKQKQEKSYSEEEMLDFGNFIFKNTLLVSVKGVEGVLKQFKKK